MTNVLRVLLTNIVTYISNHRYGFNTLAQWLIRKGADDTVTNQDGMTCYEGLCLDDLENFE